MAGGRRFALCPPPSGEYYYLFKIFGLTEHHSTFPRNGVKAGQV